MGGSSTGYIQEVSFRAAFEMFFNRQHIACFLGRLRVVIQQAACRRYHLVQLSSTGSMTDVPLRATYKMFLQDVLQLAAYKKSLFRQLTCSLTARISEVPLRTSYVMFYRQYIGGSYQDSLQDVLLQGITIMAAYEIIFNRQIIRGSSQGSLHVVLQHPAYLMFLLVQHEMFPNRQHIGCSSYGSLRDVFQQAAYQRNNSMTE